MGQINYRPSIRSVSESPLQVYRQKIVFQCHRFVNRVCVEVNWGAWANTACVCPGWCV